MKLTVHIDNVFHDEEVITDPKEIARVVKNHLFHLGTVKVYYQKPFKDLVWWRRLLLYSIGKTC